MKRFYGKVDNTVELRKLTDAALSEGKVAVGISKTGVLYIWDRKEQRPKTVSLDEAALHLGTTIAEVQKLMIQKGDYTIVDPEPEVKETPVEPEPVPEVIHEVIVEEPKATPDSNAEVLKAIDVAKEEFKELLKPILDYVESTKLD